MSTATRYDPPDDDPDSPDDVAGEASLQDRKPQKAQATSHPEKAVFSENVYVRSGKLWGLGSGQFGTPSRQPLHSGIETPVSWSRVSHVSVYIYYVDLCFFVEMHQFSCNRPLLSDVSICNDLHSSAFVKQRQRCHRRHEDSSWLLLMHVASRCSGILSCASHFGTVGTVQNASQKDFARDFPMQPVGQQLAGPLGASLGVGYVGLLSRHYLVSRKSPRVRQDFGRGNHIAAMSCGQGVIRCVLSSYYYRALTALQMKCVNAP